MKLYKFGGSSLADSECFKKVFNIVKENNCKYVVVSATKNTTNDLISLTETIDQKEIKKIILKISKRHTDIIENLSLDQEKFKEYFKKHVKEIKALLNSVNILRERTPEEIIEIISGYGELWSSFILTELLNYNKLNAQQIDARDFLTINNDETIDYETSSDLLNKIKNDEFYNIITGYLARNNSGITRTLKRNGSDYSASIIGNLIDAESVSIWTDVSGVCSADPRVVKDAKFLKNISYNEAIELAHFGASVVHPKTMTPLMKKNIPIIIKNTFKPEDIGTKITNQITNGKLVKGFTVMENLALFNIEGSALVGLPGNASKIFSKLKDLNISVILITQGSSEYSISFVINEKEAEKAKKGLNDLFEKEIQNNKLKEINYDSNVVILACVGDKMIDHIGIAGKIFKELGENNINIRSIAQGSSERNISIVLDKKDKNKALNKLHDYFFNDKYYNVFLIGVGGVGFELYNQLKNLCNSKIKISGVCNSKKMFLENKNPKVLNEEGDDFNLDSILNYMNGLSGEKIIIDCTSSEKIASKYIKLMNEGIHIITPNKKASTSDIDYYKKIKNNKSSYFYETTVGAGLPVISTLKSILETGDEIVSIEATLSGTLSYIFNNLNNENDFSEIVNKAFEMGYTEPDPRDDLSGMDVARKALILAREIGLELELKDINVESLYSKDMEKLDVINFLKKISVLDNDIKRRKGSGKLCYIASITKENVEVKLQKIDESSSFYNLSGTDNMIVFKTKYNNQNPIVIKGAGAGVEVTANGILSDLIKLTKEVKLNE